MKSSRNFLCRRKGGCFYLIESAGKIQITVVSVAWCVIDVYKRQVQMMLLTNWRRKQATVHMKLLKHGIMVIWLTQSSEKITQIM